GVVAGHDGIDYLVFSALIHSLRNGLPMPIDVYDMASWMAVTALSEQSIAMGSQPVPVPDFTCGKWIRRGPDKSSAYSL
ncbi:MAG: gfo/Idh/MocA family oxidoreductase, partial [Clostridia bacterium]|nr:gfo/Idh/MocA family oxidoreductase [Clostridia bacterium]